MQTMTDTAPDSTLLTAMLTMGAKAKTAAAHAAKASAATKNKALKQLAFVIEQQ